jgi:HemY protein
MLWSLLRVLLFIGVIILAALGAGALMESSGGVQVAFGGYEYTLGPLKALIALGLLMAAVWLVFRLLGLFVAVLKFLNGDETALSRYFQRNRERRGFQAMADALMALASGEGKAALQNAAKAETYLNRPELTNLLTAQAAELAGDYKKAEEVYKKLVMDDRTRFVGVRGLMQQKLATGDTDTAMKLAQKAFALKPAHEQVQDTLLSLQSKSGDWAGARKTLNAKLKHGQLPRDVHRRRDAVLALSEAQGVLNSDEGIEAQEIAIEANRLSPDLIPAAVMAARGYIKSEKPRLAARVLKKAWSVHPHPDLAMAFAEIAPDETPAERLIRFRDLTETQPDHIETHLLKAELYINAEDFPAAHQALGDLADRAPNARSLTILAAIERGAGADDEKVRGILARALTAPRGSQWVCDKCQHIHTTWVPTCENCAAFDTLSWREPPESQSFLAAGSRMLPMIIAPNKASLPEPEDNIITAEILPPDVPPADTP